MVTIPSLLCLWEQGIPGSSLKWVPKYILFLAKLKVEGRPFLKLASIDLFSKLPLTYRGYVNDYESVHHPLSTLPVGIGNTKTVVKKISNLLFQISVQVYSLLDQTERGEEGLFWRVQEGNHIVRLSPKHLFVIRDKKSLSFCEIRNNPNPPLLFIRVP